MAGAVLPCVAILPREAALGKTESLQHHGRIFASWLQHYECHIFGPNDLLQAPQWPTKHFEIPWCHVWHFGARCHAGDRCDLARRVCVWLCGSVRICCLQGLMAASVLLL